MMRAFSWDPEFEVYARHRADALVRTAVFLTGDRHGAEDLVQTALVRTARRWRQARQNPDAYTRAVLVNLTRDRWRRAGRRVAEVPLVVGRPEHDPADPTSPSSRMEVHDEILAALRQLPARQRATVVLRFWEGLSVAETAALLGCSEGTVKSTTSRALDRLRRVLDPDGERSPITAAGPGDPRSEPMRSGR